MSDFPSPPPPPPPGQPPPGYVAYGTPAAQGYTKPVKGIAKALIVLQIISVIASAIVLIISFGLADKAEEFVNDPTSDFDEELGGFLAAAGLSGLVTIAVIVLLIIWSFRIASNIRQRDPSLTWKPGLTIVAWIFSCLLGILPFLMMREHWKKSDRGGDNAPVSPLIVLWLVLTITSVIAGSVAAGVRGVGAGGGFGQQTEDVAEQLSDQLLYSVAQGVLSIAAAIVLILIIRQLTDRHARYTGEA